MNRPKYKNWGDKYVIEVLNYNDILVMRMIITIWAIVRTIEGNEINSKSDKRYI